MSYLGLINIEAAASGGAGGITASSTDTLTNKTITSTTNDVTAKSLHSATTVVDVSAATAPTTGQVLTATSGTAATWQAAAGGAEFTATSVKTASYTAVSGDWVLCDANAAAGDIDITLPATPSAGDAVKITLNTEHATRKVTINRNASSINGGTAAEVQTFNILWKSGDTVTFRCVATSAWVTADRCIQNRFMARVGLSAPQLNLIDTTFTKVQFDSKVYDFNGDYDNVTNFYYTAAVSGYYAVTGQITYNNMPADKKEYFVIKVDAANVSYTIQNNGAITDFYGVPGAGTFYMAAGSFLQIDAFGVFGVATVDVFGDASNLHTYFDVRLVGSKGSAGGGGGSPAGAEFTATSVKTASYTAVSGDWVLTDANAAAGDIDITLPATPTVGQAVKISLNTAHATRKITINRNGSTIDGGTAAEFQDYNILWKAGDTVTFRCVASGAWVTADRQIANRFQCDVGLSADILNLTNNTNVLVTFNTANYDYNSSFDLVTNNDYTVPITGTYLITAACYYFSVIDGGRYAMFVDKNAAGNIGGVFQHSGSTNNLSAPLNFQVDLAAGDSLKIYANQLSGVSTVDLSSNYQTFFQISLISRS